MNDEIYFKELFQKLIAQLEPTPDQAAYLLQKILAALNDTASTPSGCRKGKGHHHE